MSAVAEPPTADTETGAKVIENIRSVTEEESGMDFGRIVFLVVFLSFSPTHLSVPKLYSAC